MAQVVSDTRVVKYKFSLEEAIFELKKFGYNVLFPYIANLIKTIEDILCPSPKEF